MTEQPDVNKAGLTRGAGSASPPVIAARKGGRLLSFASTGLICLLLPGVLAEPFRPERFGIGAVLIQADSARVVTVHSCIRGGPADRAGILRGDEVVELDGHDVTSWSLQNIINYLIRDTPLPVSVTIRRGAEMLSARIVRARFSDIGAGAGVRYEVSPDSISYKAVPLVELPAAAIGDTISLAGLYEWDCAEARDRDWKGGYRFVYFWASWCGPCKVLMRRIVSERGDPASPTVIGVNLDENCETFRTVASSIQPPGEQYWAGGYHGSLAQVLRVYRRGIPTVVVLDPESRLLGVATGIDSALALFRQTNQGERE